jgi:serine/threonine-protein kinase
MTVPPFGLSPPGREFGDYTLLGVIARGGMGVVWQAVHTGLGRSCALKLIANGAVASPMEKRRFLAEAEASAVLDHPNILRIRHAGDCGGQLFLEMELVEGGTLGERLEETTISAKDAAQLLEQLSTAVQYAHERGVLHRDLKPANVLVTPEGTLKLADFGIAKMVGRSAELTTANAILGTPAYLAPEVARGGVPRCHDCLRHLWTWGHPLRNANTPSAVHWQERGRSPLPSAGHVAAASGGFGALHSG